MKSVSIAIISTSLAFQAANANDDYTNFIVQTENVPAGEIAAVRVFGFIQSIMQLTLKLKSHQLKPLPTCLKQV